jgi:cyclase
MKRQRFIIWLFIGSLLATTSLTGQQRKVTKLAEGVYAIEHSGEGGGNTTVIIGERQVLVVDSCFLPSAAREDIMQIRQWTSTPVSFVLNTHFHNDHNFGNRAYVDAFPALTIIAHVETKKDMDRFGPGSAMREERGLASLQRMHDTGKAGDGTPLTADDKSEVERALANQLSVIQELKNVEFQSATMTFDHDFTIDLGNQEVRVMFLGRGNTSGDAVVYLPKKKVLVTGDLVVYPIPYIYDGYPSDWIQTLQKLSQFDADAIVPGHGPILHDKSHILLIRDLLTSAVDQMNARLTQTRPAMFQSLDDVKGVVDLAAFRPRFTGTDRDLAAEFDDMTTHLVKVVFQEASLR